jgi:dTMP kinase
MASLGGKFVVLDGPEGCGKSTQTRMLRERLQAGGVATLAVRDPGSTRLGERIRQMLLQPDHREMGMRCEMLLYMAARAQMMHELILPALAGGQFVLCDRFVSSTLAYQLGGDGLTLDEIRRVADIAIGGRWPDLTIILDVEPSVGFSRVRRERDRIEQRPPEYHEQVRRNFLSQAQGDPARYRVVDAQRPAGVVHEELWAALGGI